MTRFKHGLSLDNKGGEEREPGFKVGMETAWVNVKKDTIIKCFAAAGISSTFSEAATVSTVTGEEEPFADLDVWVDEELEHLVQQVAPGSGIRIYLGSNIGSRY